MGFPLRAVISLYIVRDVDYGLVKYATQSTVISSDHHELVNLLYDLFSSSSPALNNLK